MMLKVALVCQVLLLCCFHLVRSFSTAESSGLQKALRSAKDVTTLPPAFLKKLALDAGGSTRVKVSTSFHEQYEVSLELYSQCATRNHEACFDLFDRYSTTLIRCEEITSIEFVSQRDQPRQFNARWEASWISSNSVWLYDLADQIGWKIETKTPDSTKVSTFSWLRVLEMFQNAFRTGTIVLPRYAVQGNTRLQLIQDGTISLEESIDLVEEADSSRLQNRVVAQEFASWLDVSRKPPNTDNVDWASKVRQRILAGVPGAGALDVDPNEDGPGVLYAFLVVCVASIGILYQTLSGEMMGSTGHLSTQCTDADQLAMGSGYMTECFINGDGPFI